MKPSLRISAVVMLVVAFAVPVLAQGKDLGAIGTFAKWAKVEIVLRGPASIGTGKPNPFTRDVDVVFTGPEGTSLAVPGFYDGDGQGRLDGNVWKVRFAADRTGKWRFRSKSVEKTLDGWTGDFTVTDPPADAPEFYRWGRLEHPGTAANGLRYLKFRDGPYWLKAGCDDPENFLGKFRNYDTNEKRLAAVDYLAAKGINSLYIMTHNVNGDHKDVWPWLGGTEAEARANSVGEVRFDVARLDEWRVVFEHMQAKGMVSYLILDDDSCWTGYDHPRYYREIVARFGYLPALLFNIGEEFEENYKTLAKGLELATLLRGIDPWRHPVGIHNVNHPKWANRPYIESGVIDFAAIQTNGTDPLRHNQVAIDWITECGKAKVRTVMVGFDEPRPEMDRRGWWSAYMGGAVWEVHTVAPYDSPMSKWEPVWTELGGARAFMESLPFQEMTPRNDLVAAGQAFCLAKPGAVYALYLPAGGKISARLAEGATYRCDWWDAKNGRDGKFQAAGTVEGGTRDFTAPAAGDWALRIVKQSASSAPAR